jgi:hypothetical protein
MHWPTFSISERFSIPRRNAILMLTDIAQKMATVEARWTTGAQR